MFVSLPNLFMDIQKAGENIDWVKNRFLKVGFQIKMLESLTLIVLFAEKFIF